MANFKSSSISGGAQNEAKLHLYLYQNFSGTNPNQTVTVKPSNKNNFGWMAINDWTIHEGREPSSKVVARAQGAHLQCNQNTERWSCSFNMVFEDERFNGSTLVVHGLWNTSSQFDLAIVGGTGQFTLAQGIVSVTKVTEDNNTRMMKLSIRLFYRTIEE